MGCNRNGECLKLANSKYPSLKSEINSSVSTLISQLRDVISSLNNLSLPGDYLGSRVGAGIKSVVSSLESDIERLNGEKGKINSFINEKILEHRSHYKSWCEMQQRMQNEEVINNETQ